MPFDQVASLAAGAPRSISFNTPAEAAPPIPSDAARAAPSATRDTSIVEPPVYDAGTVQLPVWNCKALVRFRRIAKRGGRNDCAR